MPIKQTTDPSEPRHAMAREIVRRQGLLATPQRKILAALVLSLIIHGLAGSFLDSEIPEEKITPLVAKFVKLPPPPTAQTSVAAAAKPKRKPRPIPQANAAVAALPNVDASTVPPVTEPIVEEKLPEPVAKKTEEPVAEEVAAVAPERNEVPSAPPTIDPSKLPPKKIQLGYTVFLGENKSELGPVQLTFTHENGRYKIRVSGRVRGLAAVFYPGIYQGESEGVITADGLRPEKFTEERGSPDKRREAVFDHVNKKVTTPEKEPLVIEGIAHDPLTWIVQFYFSMPKGERATFSVASTRRIDTYTMERVGKDNLATPVGNVDTQIWKGARKPRADGTGGGGSAQFWLAPEYHFVPFQIQLVSANGRSAYLELTAINAE